MGKYSEIDQLTRENEALHAKVDELTIMLETTSAQHNLREAILLVEIDKLNNTIKRLLEENNDH